MYTCDVEKLEGGTIEVIDIPLELSNLKRPKGEFWPTTYTITTSISLEDRCSNPGNIQFPQTIELSVNLITKYSIKPVTTQKYNPEIEMKSTSFTHRYTLTNLGPSETNKPYRFSLVVPKIMNAKISGCNLLNDSNSNKEDSFYNFFRAEDFNQCPKQESKSESYILYRAGYSRYSGTNLWIKKDCRVEKEWVKNDPYYVTINMNFEPKKIENEEGQLPDTFVVPTFLKTEDECVSDKTFFFSSETGKARTLKRMWPIILGVCIGAIIVGTIVFVSYKKGYINKIRVYNHKMDSDF